VGASAFVDYNGLGCCWVDDIEMGRWVDGFF
jgi:hypothetical protein